MLNRELVERGGNFLDLESGAVGPTQQSYEDIDRPTQSVPSNTHDSTRVNNF